MKRYIALILALLMMLSGCSSILVEPTESTPSPTTQSTLPTTPATEPPVDGIYITEVMPDNKKLALGHDRDWVELYNQNDSDVTLEGFSLTDDPAFPNRLPLKDLQIPAGGYLVVELGEDAPFNLSSQGETVHLFSRGESVSSVTFGPSENGESFSQAGVCSFVTPGFADTEEGYLSYLEALELPELIINEVLSSNNLYPAPNGKCYDLVEIKNISSNSVKLSDYTLSDKRSEPDRYSFPDVELQPGEFFVVYCSDDASLGKAYAPFKISAAGETVYLSKNSVLTDVLTVPGDLAKNESYGRSGKVPSYLPTPTPGKENGQGYLSGLSAPAADKPSGIYPEAVTVTLAGEGTVYYTTDGSRPTKNSRVYNEPLQLTGVTTIRTFCVNGNRTSSIAAYTYAIGVEHDLPVVCVAIPQSSLSGDTGVLNHIEENYEHEAVLTLIENGEEKFSIPFGFRLHGNDSRKMDKQNFQLRFRSKYGASKLKYPLFEDRDITEYNSLLLKGGSEDWYQANMRDEICTALVDGTTNLYTQAIKPVVLYLGGTYWGIYYLRERVSDDYVASHLGVSAESVDVLRSTAGYVDSGSNADFNALKNYVQTHDMSQQEHYEYLAERIDVLSLVDWYICRSYLADADLANIRRFRSSESDKKWRWVFFDLDWALYEPSDTSLTRTLNNRNGEPILIKAVLSSPQGRDVFLKRCNELFNTTFEESHALGVIDGLVAQIESEIPADRARWNRSVTKWEGSVQHIRDFVSEGKRAEQMKRDIQQYFDLSDEQMQAYFK